MNGTLGPELDTSSDTRKPATVDVDEAKLRALSQLYTLKENDHLLKYHTSCNEASYDLCKEDPSLINNKSTLMRLAAEKVRLTYNFKKKRSRSGQPAKKREIMVSMKIREEKKEKLKQDIEAFQLKIKHTQQQIEQYSDQKSFAQAIEGTDILGKFRLKLRQKRSELEEQQSKKKGAKRAAKRRKELRTGNRQQNTVISTFCSEDENVSGDSEVFELITLPKNCQQGGLQGSGDDMDVISGSQQRGLSETGDDMGVISRSQQGGLQDDGDDMGVISGSLQDNRDVMGVISGRLQGNGDDMGVISGSQQDNGDDIGVISGSQQDNGPRRDAHAL